MVLQEVLSTFLIIGSASVWPMKSRHVRLDGLHLYLRCLAGHAVNARYRRFDAPRYSAFRAVVLADISIDEPLQRQGLLTTILQTLEAGVPHLAFIELENVVDAGLTQHLRRTKWMPRIPGWVAQGDPDIGACWYRSIDGGLPASGA